MNIFDEGMSTHERLIRLELSLIAMKALLAKHGVWDQDDFNALYREVESKFQKATPQIRSRAIFESSQD